MSEPAKTAEEGIARAEQSAGEEWLERAFEVIEALARRQPTFIAPDVWRELDPPRGSRRALGSPMKRAVKEGLIVSTGTYQPCPYEGYHRQPVVIWRSLVYDPDRPMFDTPKLDIAGSPYDPKSEWA